MKTYKQVSFPGSLLSSWLPFMTIGEVFYDRKKDDKVSRLYQETARDIEISMKDGPVAAMPSWRAVRAIRGLVEEALS